MPSNISSSHHHSSGPPGGAALVTGGAGFLGSHIAEHLLNAGWDVTVLDDMSGGREDNVPPGAQLHVGSILDVKLLRSLFEKSRFTHVFHFAAHAADYLSHHMRSSNYLNNVVGTSNLITEAVRYDAKAFVLASTASVYGSRDDIVSENTAPEPENPYAISKFAVELDLRAASRIFGLPFIIFRLHNVYGERQSLSDPYRNVVGIYIRQCLNEQPMLIFGDGKQVRQFSYVSDVVPHIVRSVQMPAAFGRVINLGAKQEHSVIDLSRMIARSVGVEWSVKYEPARAEAHRVFVDHSLFEQLFGSFVETPLEIGLARTVRWASKNVVQPGPLLNVDLDERLPQSWRHTG